VFNDTQDFHSINRNSFSSYNFCLRHSSGSVLGVD